MIREVVWVSETERSSYRHLQNIILPAALEPERTNGTMWLSSYNDFGIPRAAQTRNELRSAAKLAPPRRH
jgi:hypothetical protein